jgi:hypothetical protein
VFDVYLVKSATNQITRVWLVDFNAFDASTDTLMFSWEEIMALGPEVKLRIVQSENEARLYQSAAPRFVTNMMPVDTIHLSDGNTLAEFASAFGKHISDAIQSE